MARKSPAGSQKARLDLAEQQFIKAGRNRGPGTYTATQTGAKQLALRRQAYRDYGDVVQGVTGSQQDFEDLVSGKMSQKQKKKP